MKAVFSTLLVQMAQCGSSGMPAIINTDNSQKIIKDVTYNWLFLENLIQSEGPVLIQRKPSYSGSRHWERWRTRMNRLQDKT
ncbi:MAG: hypothetical protein IPL50_04500 [Chitinophagaceae bacterium]|nr:hypothetical protein [Chitinophagaceae bacterium]